MFYTSTRDKSIKVTSSQAISHGISAEGGLFVPEEIPHITMDDIVRLADCDYIERAKEILSFILRTLPPRRLIPALTVPTVRANFQAIKLRRFIH